MDDISKIIYQTPFISELEKEFYSTILQERKDNIFDYCYEILKEEKEQEKNDRNRWLCMER